MAVVIPVAIPDMPRPTYSIMRSEARNMKIQLSIKHDETQSKDIFLPRLSMSGPLNKLPNIANKGSKLWKRKYG